MAVQIVRPEPVSTQRIHRRLRPVKPAPPNPQALAAVREVVRRSKSVEDAIAALTAINAAWSRVSTATQEAIGLLVTILELTDSVEEALTVFSRLISGYSMASTTLDIARKHIQSFYPGSELRIEAGDSYYDVSRAWLYVLVPADDYPSFKEHHDHLTDWWLENFPNMGGIIDVTPRALVCDV